jgi:5,10-methylene-tetrahydrofolate dehydrogenase/methenyl tetrahydrofolate cyclohydrolase
MVMDSQFSRPRSMREKVKDEISEIQTHNPRFKPGLAIVQVGDRPDSTTYVRMKGKAAQEVVSQCMAIGSNQWIMDDILGKYQIHAPDISR